MANDRATLSFQNKVLAMIGRATTEASISEFFFMRTGRGKVDQSMAFFL